MSDAELANDAEYVISKVDTRGFPRTDLVYP